MYVCVFIRIMMSRQGIGVRVCLSMGNQVTLLVGQAQAGRGRSGGGGLGQRGGIGFGSRLITSITYKYICEDFIKPMYANLNSG
jgi:hypothetical protein